jgi:hypothetical protein
MILTLGITPNNFFVGEIIFLIAPSSPFNATLHNKGEIIPPCGVPSSVLYNLFS